MPGSLAAIALVGLVLLYGPSPDYYDHRIVHAFWAYGHIAFFAVLTLLLLRWRAPRWPGAVGRRTGTLALILITLALLSELAQGWAPGRNVGADDALQNLLGVAVGFALSPQWLARLPGRWRGVPPNLALPVVAVAALVPWLALADTLHAHARFPVLLAMETELEMSRVRGNDDRQRLRQSPLSEQPLLAVRWEPPGSGLGLRHFPGDWRGYDALLIRIHSDRSLAVTLRLHDRRHEALGEPWPDRFNRRLTLEPGWQTLEVDLASVRQAPSSRTMDMARISQLGLFNLQLASSAVLHLAAIELVVVPE